jgi:IclR family KDG regulon transcriptional repressor
MSAKPQSIPLPRASVRSVDQTLDALELLSQAERPLGLGEIAQSLGISPPATHRLLSALRARGYVAQDGSTSRYTRGLACFSLAALAASRQDLRRTAAPHLDALNGETAEAVHLAVYESGFAVYIDKRESRRETAPVSRVGERAPAHCVATGRAILAYLPLTDLEALIAEGLQRFTDTTPDNRERLLADLDRTRRQGYALNRGAWRPAVGGVACPIRDFSGLVQGSIGCCVPLERFDDDRLPALARRTMLAAAAISAELGYVVPAALPDHGNAG